jgi:hypothetical protein
MRQQRRTAPSRQPRVLAPSWAPGPIVHSGPRPDLHEAAFAQPLRCTYDLPASGAPARSGGKAAEPVYDVNTSRKGLSVADWRRTHAHMTCDFFPANDQSPRRSRPLPRAPRTLDGRPAPAGLLARGSGAGSGLPAKVHQHWQWHEWSRLAAYSCGGSHGMSRALDPNIGPLAPAPPCSLFTRCARARAGTGTIQSGEQRRHARST